MEIIGLIIGAIFSYVILYFIIRSAVSAGILDARNVEYIQESDDDEDNIAKVICPSCGKQYDIDYLVCPYCKFQDVSDDDENSIAKIICPSCGKQHDIDYPACPYCKHSCV